MHCLPTATSTPSLCARVGEVVGSGEPMIHTYHSTIYLRTDICLTAIEMSIITNEFIFNTSRRIGNRR